MGKRAWPRGERQSVRLAGMALRGWIYAELGFTCEAESYCVTFTNLPTYVHMNNDSERPTA